MKSWLKGLYYELNVNSLMKNEKYEISQIFIALKKIFPCLKQWSIQICELTIWLKNWFITLTRVQHFWNWALIEFFEFRENWVHVESGREVLGQEPLEYLDAALFWKSAQPKRAIFVKSSLKRISRSPPQMGVRIQEFLRYLKPFSS